MVSELISLQCISQGFTEPNRTLVSKKQTHRLPIQNHVSQHANKPVIIAVKKNLPTIHGFDLISTIIPNLIFHGTGSTSTRRMGNPARAENVAKSLLILNDLENFFNKRMSSITKNTSKTRSYSYPCQDHDKHSQIDV